MVLCFFLLLVEAAVFFLTGALFAGALLTAALFADVRFAGAL